MGKTLAEKQYAVNPHVLADEKVNALTAHGRQRTSLCGGNVKSIQPDGRLLIEIHGIMGGHNLQGNTLVGAVTI